VITRCSLPLSISALEGISSIGSLSLKPGMNAYLQLTSESEPMLLIPSKALIDSGSEHRFAFTGQLQIGVHPRLQRFIRVVDLQAQLQGAGVQLRLQVNNPDEALKPGMNAYLQLTSESEPMLLIWRYRRWGGSSIC
jgi:hypothetical protein